MKETYNDAMKQVYLDEGGYTNDAADPGGPTNWGITIWDARKYWKPDATAADVRAMTKDVAAAIYEKHYAAPLNYNDLPAGVDYAMLDYGINSGISRAIKVAQGIVHVTPDGLMGPNTLAAIQKTDPTYLVNAIYSERLAFLKNLRTWSTFGRGWSNRVATGKKLALSFISKYPPVKPTLEQFTTPTTQDPLIMFTSILTSWKTTLAGISAIGAALAAFFSAGVFDSSHMTALLSALAVGLGMIFSKDSNVTGTTPKATA